MPTAEYRDCATCGTEFWATRRTTRFCSRSCLDRKKRVRAGRWVVCVRCNKTFHKNHTEIARSPAHYCSKRCAKAKHGTALVGPLVAGPHSRTADAPASRRFTARPCQRCGTSVLAEGDRLPTHCHTCPSRVWTAGDCAECGTSFVVLGHGRYCSAPCARRGPRRRAKQKRSKRIQSGLARDPITLPKIAARDGWRCHICTRKVTRKDWSLDHLIPLSCGGDHTYANVALAHHRCNTLRGATGHAQLRLAA